MNNVKEIHEAVDRASEVLLMDMPYDRQKVDILKGMGFTSAEEVRDYKDHGENHSLARYYAQRYPSNKFITEHQFEKVRLKYNLEQGRLSSFKGSIPTKNILEMQLFRIEEKDVQPAPINFNSRGGFAGGVFQMNTADFYASTLNVQELYASLMGVSTPEPSVERRVNRNGKAEWTAHFVAYAKKHHKREEQPVMLSFDQINQKYANCISITADKALFNAPDPDLDPIVAVSVKGGYLVITAWGDEANDPDIVNAKMN